MNKCTLTEEALRHIDDLIKITTSYYVLRKQCMEKIVKKDDKQTDEYKLNLERQRMALQMEEKKYENDFCHPSKIRATIDYLMDNYKIPRCSSFLNDILASNSNEIIINRIIYKLYYYDYYSEEEYNGSAAMGCGNLENKVTILNNVLIGQQKISNCETYKDHLDKVEINVWLEKAAKQLFLINLEKIITNNEYEIIKTSLTEFKNNFLFLNSWLDDEYIIYEYDNILIDPKLNNPILIANGQMKKFDTHKNDYGYYGCDSIIEKFAKLVCKEENLSEKDFTDIILMQTYLKTCLSFIDNHYLIFMLRNKMYKTNINFLSKCDDSNKGERIKRTKSTLQIFEAAVKQYVKK